MQSTSNKHVERSFNLRGVTLEETNRAVRRNPQQAGRVPQRQRRLGKVMARQTRN